MDLGSLANLSLAEIAATLNTKQQEVLLASISVAASYIQQLQAEEQLQQQQQQQEVAADLQTQPTQHNNNYKLDNSNTTSQEQQQSQISINQTTRLLLEEQFRRNSSNNQNNISHNSNATNQTNNSASQHYASPPVVYQDYGSPDEGDDFLDDDDDDEEDEELDHNHHHHLGRSGNGRGHHNNNNRSSAVHVNDQSSDISFDDYSCGDHSLGDHSSSADRQTLLTIREFAEELKHRRKSIRLSQKGAAQSLRAFTSGEQPCTDAIIYHFENLQLEPDRAMTLIPLLRHWLEWAEKHRLNGKQLPMMSAVTKVPRERKRKVVLFNEKAKQNLEDAFLKNNHPDRYQLDVISQELNIPTRSIRKWFTNRRQRKRFAEKFSPVS